MTVRVEASESLRADRKWQFPLWVKGETVKDVLESLKKEHKLEIVLKHADIFLNGDEVLLPQEEMTPVPEGAEVLIVQNIAGGC